MLVKDIINFLDSWAPPGVAWGKDNTGLQVGSLTSEVSNILLSLDCTLPVLHEALHRKCNLVISHHPLLFSPMKKINTDSDDTSKILSFALQNNIILIAYHTNLDFTKGGVNHALASLLNLQNIRFLESASFKQFKLVVFVPPPSLHAVRQAMCDAGAGQIGEYSNCSFTTSGKGTFLPSENANPAIGQSGIFESVEEQRLEVIVHEWQLSKVISALRQVHPYEEPAFDIYPLRSHNSLYGVGVIGELPEPVTDQEFLKIVGKTINPWLSYNKGKSEIIKTVAVCGGSGSELIPKAISSGADAFITADVRYHAYHDANEKILLINAGHYETEAPVLGFVKKRIDEFLADAAPGIQTMLYSSTTNPVHYFYK